MASFSSWAIFPPYRSGASATKPSRAKRSATSAMWSSSPHHSWMTITPGPFPEAGFARYPCASLPLLGNVTFWRGLSDMLTSGRLRYCGEDVRRPFPRNVVSRAFDINPSRVCGQPLPASVRAHDHRVVDPEDHRDRHRELVTFAERMSGGSLQRGLEPRCAGVGVVQRARRLRAQSSRQRYVGQARGEMHDRPYDGTTECRGV